MTDREKLIEMIRNAVGGCTRYWAWLIADHLLDNGVTFAKDINVPSRWTPVTERLPEEGDRCLCRIKSFAFPGSSYQSILRYDKYGFADGSIYEEGVTHWMPLPEPPKEE